MNRSFKSLLWAGVLPCLAAAAAQAQTQAPAPTVLPPVSVEGTAPKADGPVLSDEYQPKAVQSPKFTEPLLDTPRTIQVIPQQVIQEQGARSLTDVLRNVPGVSLQAGEGGGGNTETLRLRGFAANDSLTIDGRRDRSSVPNRDTFNLEQVEIIKGSAGSVSGARGATGGTINLVTKTPQLDQFIAGTAAVGTQFLRRATIDANTPLSIAGLDTSAFRINLMDERSPVAGRDTIDNERYGISPSLAFGIGTPTRVTLSASKVQFDEYGDHGLPSTRGRVQVPIDKGNYYGIEGLQTSQVNQQNATVKIEHDFRDWLTIREQLSYNKNGSFTILSPLSAPNTLTNTVTANPTANERNDKGVYSQTDLTWKFDTMGLSHTAVTGAEFSRETFEVTTFTRTGGAFVQNLFSPDPNLPFPAGFSFINPAELKTEAGTMAFYAFDTLKINEMFELNGGLRWDQFTADQFAKATQSLLSRTDSVWSYSIGGVYKPVPNASLYVSYSSASNPAAESLALSGANTNAANVQVGPEKTVTYEVGAKWDVLRERLSLTAALFRIDKTNARTEDPNNALDIIVTEGEQRVDGIELGVAGALTDKWNIYANLSWMDGEITTSKNPLEVGHNLSRLPEQSFSLWTTYELPWNLQIGGGTQYVGRMNINTTTPAQLDSYWLWDAMIAYHLVPGVDIRLNGYNLTDEYYIAKAHGGGSHVVPGPGRAAVLSTSFKF